MSTAPPSNRVTITREGDRYRVRAWDIHGRLFRDRLSPAFSQLAFQRTWALQQAEKWADYHYLQFDDTIEGESVGEFATTPPTSELTSETHEGHRAP